MGAVRLSVLSRFPVIYVMTHDSIGLGEDGPTHQPVEILNYLRCTPNLLTIRPADGNETAGAYHVALTYAPHGGQSNTTTPVVISLSRQACPTLPNTCSGMVSRGAYTLQDVCAEGHIHTPEGKIDLVLVATGTEVHLAHQVANHIVRQHNLHVVRVVSMPCSELFDQQTSEYKHSVFPKNTPVMSIEASSTAGWRNKYAHAAFGIPEDCYGVSAPAERIYQHFGFSVENLATQGRKVVDFYAGQTVPDLFSFPEIVATPKPLH